ncbi:MAG: molybdopterin biosynthesis protein, partial [Lachnospiraceae bacterium]|nr:molybdopterin biosynthesis protein [Lachnospiraceae bacterium]
MAFQYLTNMDLDEAKEKYLARLKENGLAAGTELISTIQAGGRRTAKAVYAHISAPHYPASAMDGIAVFAKDTFGATETTSVSLKPEQYIVVDTGDPLPGGCDAVIMVEDIVTKEDGSVTIYAPAAPWQHVRQIGEDICAGEMVLPSHMVITPAAIGALLAAGVLEVEVQKRPVVGIIPTGDEIVAPTAEPKAGDIIEFNSSIFSAMLRDWDAEPVTYPITKDKKEDLRAALQKALAECDMVILNAGSSAGREDYSTETIAECGEVLAHGIAIKPGKPAILGLSGAKPVLGVPGYPVSGIIVLEQFMKPVVDAWYNRAASEPVTVKATLTRPVLSGLKYREFVRVRLGSVGGKLMAS